MIEKKVALKDYIEYKKLTIHSEKIKDLEFYIKQFIESNDKDLKDFQESDLIAYLNKINPKYTSWTMNYIKANTKNFIKWYFVDWSSKFRNIDKICRTETPESSYKPEDMISESDFEKLIKGESDQFWKAYFVTLFYGCCRPIEVCGLKWKDVEFEKDGGAFFNVSSKKNKRTFLKYLPKESAFFLKQLMNNNSEYVFFNKVTKAPITKKGAYHRIRKLSKETLGKQIDLYTLRHSVATINYNKDNVKDDIVAQQMGHTKSMKKVYCHNDRNRLKENAKKIYVGDLPPEQRHELEIRFDQLNNKFLDLQKKYEKSLLNQEELLIERVQTMINDKIGKLNNLKQKKV